MITASQVGYYLKFLVMSMLQAIQDMTTNQFLMLGALIGIFTISNGLLLTVKRYINKKPLGLQSIIG